MECGISCGVKGLKAMVAKSRAKVPACHHGDPGRPHEEAENSISVSQGVRSSEQDFFKTI